MSDGVILESIYSFMHADHFTILRPRNSSSRDRKTAVKKAYSYLGLEYDFNFDYESNDALYCTELIGKSWENIIPNFQFQFSNSGLWPILEKRKSLVADEIFLSNTKIIFMTKGIKKFKVWSKRKDMDDKHRFLQLSQK
ncbi:hypothetical protein MJH12_03440 [bacterium]|nr:hypothetical protein [bacterium]